MDKLPEIMFDMYEIDSNIKLLDKIQKNDVRQKQDENE